MWFMYGLRASAPSGRAAYMGFCLQGVLIARNLQELLFIGTQGHDAVVP